MKTLKITLLSFLAFILFIVPASYSQAETPEEAAARLSEIQKQINELQGQLSNARGQEKTLKSQLDYIDAQTKLTQLKMDETTYQITKLEGEINDLSTRITRLSTTVDSISQVLLVRITQTYKHGNFSAIDLLFSSHGFADLLERMKYLQVAQENDKKVLYQLQATKAAYNDQKTDKETRQLQHEKLKKDLERYQGQLVEQKKAKAELLKITQNEEAKFQSLIAKLQADAASISRALGGAGVKLGEVSRGDRIAGVGNSGCSTGSHLHFEVMTPARVEERDGKHYIIGAANKVDPKPFIDSGQFNQKPTTSYSGRDCSECAAKDIRNGDITTRFNQWYYVLKGSGSAHTGLDIADFFGASIYTAEKGISYAFSDSQACSLTGTVGKGVVVDHQNGYVTLYWHIP